VPALCQWVFEALGTVACSNQRRRRRKFPAAFYSHFRNFQSVRACPKLRRSGILFDILAESHCQPAAGEEKMYLQDPNSELKVLKDEA
jgi:hypothetical protein